MSAQNTAVRKLPGALSRRHPNILTVAHRGAWTHAPENSIGAIEAAIRMGVDMVEIDTQTTADGILVVIHDETLDRTTNGRGVVHETQHSAMRDFTLRMGWGTPEAPFTEEKIPLLEVALEIARDRVFVNVDTKYPRDLSRVIALVRDMGMTDQVLIKSEFDLEASRQHVEDLDVLGTIVHMPMMPARRGRFAEDLRRIAYLRSPMVEIIFSDLADVENAREELQRQDIRVWANTLDGVHSMHYGDTEALRDPEGVWGRLIDAGVGMIQTDRPEELRAFLASRELGSVTSQPRQDRTAVR